MIIKKKKAPSEAIQWTGKNLQEVKDFTQSGVVNHHTMPGWIIIKINGGIVVEPNEYIGKKRSRIKVYSVKRFFEKFERSTPD